MGMHEKASRKYYFSTKYSESMNTNNKLYAKAVVNQSRIYLQLSKAQCAIAVSNGCSPFFSFLMPANMEKVLCDKSSFRAASRRLETINEPA